MTTRTRSPIIISILLRLIWAHTIIPSHLWARLPLVDLWVYLLRLFYLSSLSRVLIVEIEILHLRALLFFGNRVSWWDEVFIVSSVFVLPLVFIVFSCGNLRWIASFSWMRIPAVRVNIDVNYCIASGRCDLMLTSSSLSSIDWYLILMLLLSSIGWSTSLHKRKLLGGVHVVYVLLVVLGADNFWWSVKILRMLTLTLTLIGHSSWAKNVFG